MKNIGRFFSFSIAFIAIFGAFGGLVWSFGHAALGRESTSITLCNLSSPEDLAVGAYLEAHATELEQPAGSDDTPVNFVVQSGESAATIANRLEQKGLISDAELFRRYMQYHGLDAGIEAGEFTLRQTMTVPEIAQALQTGRRPEQTITIQEGLRLEQVAAKVAEQTTISEENFLQLATSGWRDAYSFGFLSTIPPTATLEGFLYPETYRLPEDATADDLVGRMLETFDARVTPAIQAITTTGSTTSLYDTVTLASIVEREAVLDKERPIIAGVYQNRLEAGWTLDACPTVQYAIGSPDNWWPPFTLEATQTESPYNTYRNRGLPPSPICSPGLASIKAAAQPADTDYFFFLVDCAKSDGSHLFSETQEEHNANYRMCGEQAP